MMILPSLAKHASAEDVDNSGGAKDLVTANNGKEKDVIDDHTKANSSEITHQEAQTSDSDVNSTLNASHAPHGSNSHLVPSHHLSTLSHPQIHYVPSVSMPTISSGSNGQPSHSNVPTTPTLPVTNDKPVLNHISSQTVNEGDPKITGQITSTDIDHGDTATYSSPLTQPGFTLNTDGTYTVDPTDPSFEHLAVGEHQTLIIPVIATDNNGGNSVSQNLVIRIDGTNDKPIVSSWAQLPDGVEDKTVIIKESDLLTQATDVDTSDTLTVTHLQAEHGTIVDNKDGTYTYSPDKDYNGEVRLTYRVEDGHGGQVDTQARFNLAAVGDTAKIGGQDTATLEEFGDRTSAFSDMTDHSPDHHHANESKLFNQILSVSGHLTITDPDLGEAEFQWKPTVNGQYGHLSIWDNGNWVYEVSAGNSAAGRAIDKLGQGEELTDTMTVYSKDGTPHDIVITIHGDNDRPYCSSEVILNAGTEDTRQNLTVADLLQNSVDVDHNDAGLLTIANLHADHGSIAINKDGSFSFTPDKDYNGPVLFTYDVKDAHGGVTRTHATTNLAAVGDAAIITGDDKADVHEDSKGNQTQYGASAGGYGYDLTVKGKLDIVDPDQGEDNFPQGHGSSTWYTGDHGGQLIIGAKGSWTYNINNAAPSIQRLGQGESMVDTVQVHSADGTTHNIAITIHGTNDAPVLAAQTHSVTEDGSVLKGTMIATDVDHGDKQIFSISNAVDGLTFNANGSYSFDPSNAAYQHLANGQTQTLTIPVTVTDSAGATDTQNLAITITGTNDASVLANGLASATVTEDQTSSANQLSSSWQNLAITDVDSTAEAAIVQIEVNGVLHQVPADFAMSLQGDHGTFHTTHGTDGHDKWRYTADNTHSEIQGLKDGQSLTDSITLITADGTRIPITATIQGADDHVIIDTPNAVTASLGTAIEDTNTSISGMLAAHDVDTDDSVHFEVQNTAGSYGTLSVSQDGSWHYDLDPAKANPLNPWDNVPEVFNVVAVSSDGSKATQRIQVNVQGTSDAAIINGVDKGSIIEDQHIGSSSLHTIAVSGLLTVTDPDAGQDHFQFSQFGEQAMHDPFGGSLHITPQGDWGYSVSNSALQHIHEGDTDNVVYRVQSADGTSHLIIITVTGTNDAPVLTAQTQSVIEDGSALKGQMQATDVDDNTHLTFEIATPVDGLTFNADGSYTFDPSNASYQHLGAGQDQTITIPVTVKDEVNATSTQNLTIIVHGTNDGAIISGDTSGASKEDTSLSVVGHAIVAQGQLTVSDVDTGEATFPFQQGASVQGYGKFLVAPSGRWSYSTNNDDTRIQALGEGETLTDTFKLHSADGTEQTITVTIEGTNDVPTVSSAVALTAGTEDVAQTITTAQLLANATDVDTSDVLSIANLAVNHGTFTGPDSSGNIHFIPEPNYNGTVTFTYDVTDTHNGSVHTTATTDLSAVGDAAVITGPDLDITEDVNVDTMGRAITVHGQLNIVDPDTGESHFDPNIVQGTNGPQVGYTSTHGAKVLMDPDGSYSYIIDNDSKTVQQLAEGESLVDTVTIKSADGTTHDINVTIHGTNDAPVLGVTQTTHATGTLTETDVDTSDTHQFSVTQGTGHFGTLTVDSQTGAYTYTPNGSVVGMQYNSLLGHYVGEEIFEVKVVDNHGAESSKFMTFGTQGFVSAPAGTGTGPVIVTTTAPVIGTTPPPVFGATPAASNAVTLDLASSSDSGNSQTDNLTNDTTPTIDGHTDIPFSQVTIYDGSQNAIGHGTSDASGNFSITVSTIGDGVHHLSAYALDPSAVVPTISSNLDITVDTQADIGVHMVQTPTGGHIDALQLYMGQDVTATSIQLVDEHGNHVTIDPTVHMTPRASSSHPDHNYVTYNNIDVSTLSGTVHVEVEGIDTAGNTVQDHSGSYTVEVLSAISVSLTHDTGTDTTDLITNDGSLSISGQNNGTSLQYSTDGGHHWLSSFTPSQGLNTVEVRQISVAGGTSTTASLTFTLDNQTSAPTVLLTTDSGTDSTDSITNVGGITATVTEQGATLEYSNDGGKTWSATEPTPVEGTNTVLVHQTDVAGNVSPSATISYTLDTQISATDDHGTATEDQGPTATSGNVLTNDDTGSTVVSTDVVGNYGTYHFKADGSYTYELDNSKVQDLAQGQTHDDHVQYEITDGVGNITHATLTTTITGTNDAALITGVDQGFVNEDTAPTMSTHLRVSDVDAGEEHFQAGTLTGKYGSAVLQSDGSLTYTLDNSMPAVQALGSSDHIQDVVTVTSTDGTTHDVTVTIQGTNDAAHISGVDHGSVYEDTSPVVSTHLRVSDVDAGEDHFQAGTLSGSYGSAVLKSDGSLTYTLDNSISTVQALGAGESLPDVVKVTSADGTTHDVTITIHGTNDAPVLGVTQTTSSTGTLTETDVDTSDTHTFSVVQGAGQFGTLSVDPQTGAYTYTPGGAVQGMHYDSHQGHYVGDDTFEIKVVDNNGGESSKFITFTAQGVVSTPTGGGTTPTVTTSVPSPALVTSTAPVTGANPTASNAVTLDLASSSDSGNSQTDNLTNDTTPTIDGHTNIPFSKVTIYDGSQNAIGHGTSDASGNFSITVSTMGDGVHHLTASALDPSAATPTISPDLDITVDTSIDKTSVDLQAGSYSGISDSDDLTNVDTPILTGVAQANAAISITDETGAVVATTRADSQGNYQVATQPLNEGSHTLTVTATDNAGNVATASQPINIDLTAPALARVDLGSGQPSVVSLTGTTSLDTASVDIVIKHNVNQSAIEIQHIQAHLDGKGGYSVDSTQLPDGPYTAYITATDKAGNVAPVVMDRFGVDTHANAPTISFESTGTDAVYNAAEVAHGHAGTITATVHIPSDAQEGHELTINGVSHILTAADKSHGSFTVDVEVVPGSTVTAFVTDEYGNVSATVSETAAVADTVVSALTVALTHDTGTNGSDLITNDGSLTVTGQETGAHVEYSADGGQTWTNTFTPQTGPNTVEVRQTDSAGNVSTPAGFTFILDNQVSPPLVRLSHDTGSSQSDLVTNDGSLTVAPTEANAVIEYSIDNGQHWSRNFAPTEGVNNVQVRQTDGAGNVSPSAIISYTLDTTAPTVASGATGQTVEDTTTSASGTLVATNAEHIIWQANAPQTGTYGTLSFDEHTATWTYQLDHSKADSLTAHENRGETFTVTGADAAGNVIHQTITVNVQGTDDLPVISSSQLGDVIEAGGANLGIAQISGDLSASDVDASGTFHWSVVNGTGAYGNLTLDDNGHWQYILDNTKANSLSQGQVETEDFEVEVMSPDGGKTIQHVTVSVHGSLDSPTLTATQESTTFSPVLAEADFTQLQGNQDIELLGYQTTNIVSGGQLDIAAASSQLVSKPTGEGVGVEGAGNSQFDAHISHEINIGETLLLHLNGAARSAIVQLSSFDDVTTLPNSAANDKAHWMAFDDAGKLVGEGDVQPSLIHNGRFEITSTSAFSYIAVQAVDTGTGNSRFYLNSAEANLIQYDTKVNLVGQLSDVSNTDALVFHVSGMSASASFDHGTRESDGSWTITAAQAQDLHLSHAGDLHLHIEAIATDSGETATSSVVDLDVTRQGMKYTTVSGVHKASVTEDNIQDVSEQLHIESNVQGPHTFIAQNVTTASGVFAVTSDGHWTFHVDTQALQTMNVRDVHHETFTVQTNTGESIQVNVDVRGNDDPTILGGSLTAVMNENQTTAATGNISLTDVDTVVNPAEFPDLSRGHGDAGFDYDGTYGTLHVSTDGAWRYTLDATKTEQLQAGEVVHETFDRIIAGSLSHFNQNTLGQVDIEIHGSNNVPIISGATSGSVEEDVTLHASGQLHITDVDTGADGLQSEASFVAFTDQVSDHGYGYFSIDTDGSWHFDLDNTAQKVQGLAAGQHVTDTVTVTTADGSSQVITVDIEGNDDTTLQVNTHPAPPPPGPSQVQHDVPDDVDSFTVDLVEDSSAEAHLDISALQSTDMHNEQPAEIAPATGAAAYLDALGISPNAGTGETPQQPLPDDIDIVLTQADQLATDHDLSTGLDLSDALSQDDHQHMVKHDDEQDNIEHHHVADLPDIDPNS
ncbi:VCBS domain-containing protein [Vibrio sp. 10N.261.46.C10]